MPAWLLKILVYLAGDVVAKYILPLLRPELNAALTAITPIAEYWVKAVATNAEPGPQKKISASRQIWKAIEKQKIKGVLQSDVDTAIQLAYSSLGLDTKKRKVSA